tara:strand:+ start:1808 stop:2017 length:210 start_codon:yes stop_codon:yes gene_type:complete
MASPPKVTAFALIYVVGVVVVFVVHLIIVPSRDFALINYAFWTAAGWPIFALGLALGFVLSRLMPDKTP